MNGKSMTTDKKVIGTVLLCAIVLLLGFYFVEFLPHIGS